MEKIRTMEEAMHNPDLSEVVQIDNKLKTFVIDAADTPYNEKTKFDVEEYRQWKGTTSD